MSDTFKAPTAEEADRAFGVIFEKVGSQVFFHRLSQHGIVPRSEKEAGDLLRLNALLMQREEQQKEAADSRFAGSVARLAGVLGAGQPEDVVLSQRVKAAAADLMRDPEIYESMIRYRAYEAAQLRPAAN